MKRVYFGAVLFCTVVFNNQISAQGFDQPDKNPIDISYLRQNNISKPLVKVIYGRPQKISEKVFGHQIPYGEIWRTGANEATEVVFFNDMKFGNKMVKAGTYVLHTIPGEKEWTIILNTNTDTWGAFFYDRSKDVARIKVSAKKAEELDIFSIAFKKSFKHTYMVLAWDSTRINIPLSTQNEILARI
jgi:hypothetical protein